MVAIGFSYLSGLILELWGKLDPMGRVACFQGGTPWGLATLSLFISIDAKNCLAKFLQIKGLWLNSSKQKSYARM
jgi:hypothetical protein